MKMSVVTIDPEYVRHEGGVRFFKCPKCGRWNRVRHQRLIQKIFVVTCKGCGTRYRPK